MFYLHENFSPCKGSYGNGFYEQKRVSTHGYIMHKHPINALKQKCGFNFVQQDYAFPLLSSFQ